jgi:H+/Cl- antiporter ClcA
MPGDGFWWITAIMIGVTIGLLVAMVLTVTSWMFGLGLDRASMTIACPICGALVALVSKNTDFENP